MEYRPIQLPVDLAGLGEMICDAFQYPENPGWSVQTDEKDDISYTLRSFRRIWPLVRMAQFISPSTRDMFRGYVAIEDEKIVGVTIIERHGKTDTWVVGTVGVVPEYRRMGIARQTIQKSLEVMKERGAERAWLGVINGNTPAQKLYESLGFDVYDAIMEYSLSDPTLPSVPSLPSGYDISRLSPSDWKTRFTLEKRITPKEASLYEPVEKGRFRQPLVFRLLAPIINMVQRKKIKGFIIRQESDGKPVARCHYSVSMRGKGVNAISVRLDPNYPELACGLVGMMLHHVVSQSPKLRVEIVVPKWMPAVAEAAELLGFKERVEYLKMGLSW